jgi:hypothetical protein
MTEGERGQPAEALAPPPAAVVRLGPGEPFDVFYHREMPGLVAFDSPAALVRRVCANQATSAAPRVPTCVGRSPPTWTSPGYGATWATCGCAGVGSTSPWPPPPWSCCSSRPAG